MRRILLSIAIVIMLCPQGTAQQATLLGRWFDDELIGSNVYNNVYNEIWGLFVNGKEFAVLGSTAGTHIIDISNPSDPVQTNFIQGAVHDGQIIHRDFHDYAGYLYIVADEGSSTLQIVDISNIPNTAPKVYDSHVLIQRTHNIFIDEENARMYAFHTRGTSIGYESMRIFDLTDPENPAVIAGYDEFGGFPIGHVHDGYVRDNVAFLNCGGDGLFIVDFDNPDEPELLARFADYPDKGYNHSGWLTDDGNYYYMADENHAFDMKIMDVGNPCEAEVIGTFDAGTSNPFAITHNQIVACDYLYTSHYYDGLQVFDISDQENPVKILEYDTYSDPDGQSYKGAWGVYPLLPSGLILISDMQTGLYVFEGVGDNCHNTKEFRSLEDPCNPQVPTGIFESSDLEGIYPQPVRSGATLNVPIGDELTGEVRATLYSLDGKMMQEWAIASVLNSRIQLKMSQKAASGMYVLVVDSDQGRNAGPVQILTK